MTPHVVMFYILFVKNELYQIQYRRNNLTKPVLLLLLYVVVTKS